MTRPEAARNWNKRGIAMACSEDEDARVGFLLNAYMACDSEGRNAIIAAAGSIADTVKKRRAANPATVLNFSRTEG